jgi:hypothetical protein
MTRFLSVLLSGAAFILQGCAANDAGGGNDLLGSSGMSAFPLSGSGGLGAAGVAGPGTGGSSGITGGGAGGATGVPASGTGGAAGVGPGAGTGGSTATAGTGGSAATAGAGGTTGTAGAGAAGTGGTAAGTLTVQFTTVTYGGEYAPLNYGAVWFEKADGTFIKTAKQWAGALHATDLVAWTEASGGWSIFGGNAEDMMDAMSSATIRTHQMHTVTWDMKDLDEQLVPDGPYVAVLEMSESRARDRMGPLLRIPFTKGPSPQSASPQAQEGFTGVMLSYEP